MVNFVVDEKTPIGADFVKTLRENISTLLSHCMGGRSEGDITTPSGKWDVKGGEFVIINKDLLEKGERHDKDWKELFRRSTELVKSWGNRSSDIDDDRYTDYTEEDLEVEDQLRKDWNQLVGEILSSNDRDRYMGESIIISRLIEAMDINYLVNQKDFPELSNALVLLPAKREFHFTVTIVQKDPDFGIWLQDNPQFVLYKVVPEKTRYLCDVDFGDDQWKIRDCYLVTIYFLFFFRLVFLVLSLYKSVKEPLSIIIPVRGVCGSEILVKSSVRPSLNKKFPF